MEEFRVLHYFGSDIQVSNQGTIIVDGKIRKWNEGTDGYWQVSLKIYPNDFPNGRWVSVGVHRLVALAFVPNPNNYPEVNHKDYNRKNPCANNLEWVTHRENVLYSLCNKPDVSGTNNPNYGNRKLSEKYKNDKELAKECQSRQGLQNGRCRSINVYYDGEYIISFDYIELCCQYFIQNGLTKATKIKSVRGRIDGCIKKNTKYLGHYTFVKQ